MIYLDSGSIREMATHIEWVETIEAALKFITDGDFIMPKRMHLDRGEDTFLLMPCITDEYYSVKLVSFCPDNKKNNRPSIYGTLVLNDSKTGEPLAIMEGGIITAMRTASVTAAGIKHLTQENCHSLGIVGAGVQGIYQALFACSVRKIDEIWAFDHNTDNLRKFKGEMNSKRPDIRINLANDTDSVALNSQVIITSTSSREPVFSNRKEIFTGRTFIGIGSYKPDFREFPEQIFRQANQVFVDTFDGKSESGDLLTPLKNNWIAENNIYLLGSLIAGNVAASESQTRLFKTVGSAIFDLFAARLIYEKHTALAHHRVPSDGL